MTYLEIARQMYCGDIPSGLESYLRRVAAMVERAGGLLESRQAIGAAIVAWEYATMDFETRAMHESDEFIRLSKEGANR